MASLCCATGLLLPLAAHAQMVPGGGSGTSGSSASADANRQGFLTIVDLAMTYDSNVTRQPDATGTPVPSGPAGALAIPVASWIEHAGVQVNYNLGTGRERLYALGEIARDDYTSESIYNSTTDHVKLGWNSSWPLGILTELSGDHATALANQADFLTVERDLITRDAVTGKLLFPVAGKLFLVGAFEDSRTRHSLAANAPTDNNAVFYSAGVGVFPDPDHDASLLLRRGNTTYPDAGAAAAGLGQTTDSFAEVALRWQVTGFSALAGRFGYQRHEYDLYAFRNVSGPSADLTYLWTPYSRLTLRFEVQRVLGSPGDNQYLSATTTAFNFAPLYAFTDKLRFGFRYDNARSDYDANLLLLAEGLSSPAQTRNDTTQSYGLTALWKPRTEWEVASELRHEERTSTLEAGKYHDQVFLLRAKLKW